MSRKREKKSKKVRLRAIPPNSIDGSLHEEPPANAQGFHTQPLMSEETADKLRMMPKLLVPALHSEARSLGELAESITKVGSYWNLSPKHRRKIRDACETLLRAVAQLHIVYGYQNGAPMELPPKLADPNVTELDALEVFMREQFRLSAALGWRGKLLARALGVDAEALRAIEQWAASDDYGTLPRMFWWPLLVAWLYSPASRRVPPARSV